MFAPPPVQLSRAQIQARLAEKDAGIERNDSPNSDPKSPSLHRFESRSPTSPRKKFFFGKGEKIQVSAPIASGPSCPSPEKQNFSTGASKVARTDIEAPTNLPAGFAEHPREAPKPPNRPSVSSQTSFTPSVEAALQPSDRHSEDALGSGDVPPPIPPKSPRRRYDASNLLDATLQQSLLMDTDRITALPHSKFNNEADMSLEDRIRSNRSLSAPSVPVRTQSASNARRLDARTRALKSAGFDFGILDTGVKGARIEKGSTSSKNVSSIPPLSLLTTSVFEGSEMPPRRATDGDISQIEAFSSSSVSNQEMMGQRNNNNTLPPAKHSVRSDTSAKPPSHLLNFVDKALPETPTSTVTTPIEVYQSGQKDRRMSTSRKTKSKRRTPLKQISATHAKANSKSPGGEQLSPRRLTMIPEYSAVSENSRRSSGSSTPTLKQMHIRGGSVVTVSPPELSAWQRIIYIQGPIKLPKPEIVPKKNSVASLDPFQEAVDHVYQGALNIPRRRSDDRVLDDVCDFFDEFGFDEVSFAGDILIPDSMLMELDEEEEDVPERFSTPPVEPPVTPVEKTLAKDIVETMNKQPPVPVLTNLPGHQETLRARGVASLTQWMAVNSNKQSHGRKDSSTLSVHDVGRLLPLLPLPEVSILDTVLKTGKLDNNKMKEAPPTDPPLDQGEQGFDWDDGVEELDGSSAWVAPAAVPRKHGLSRGLSGKQTKNPVTRMRNLVATAAGVL